MLHRNNRAASFFFFFSWWRYCSSLVCHTISAQVTWVSASLNLISFFFQSSVWSRVTSLLSDCCSAREQDPLPFSNESYWAEGVHCRPVAHRFFFFFFSSKGGEEKEEGLSVCGVLFFKFPFCWKHFSCPSNSSNRISLSSFNHGL